MAEQGEGVPAGSIRVTVKTPKSKEDFVIDENATVKEVRSCSDDRFEIILSLAFALGAFGPV